ncbi:MULTISPECIES: VOC family protein [unclassified Pseudonocardia]|uniref:VOC family protein n=1 Tax=unclassified Pseudonocardia TaxID=2619320 RepID=UPI001D0439DC
MTCPLNIVSVVLGAHDVGRAVRFWSTSRDYRLREEPEPDWAVLTPTEGDRLNISITSTEEGAPDRPGTPRPLHRPTARRDHPPGATGGARVDCPHYSPAPDFVVLVDPDGSIFCVIDRSAKSAGMG